VYAREIEGVEHTFGVSGKLIMNALVMYDHQTRTLWSQFLGQGVKGPLAGVELGFVPVVHTVWVLWQATHPDTLVLDKAGRYRNDTYRYYYRNGSKGVLGETRKDDRLEAKAMVVGVRVDGRTKAYPFEVLRDQPVVNDSVADRDIVVFLERGTDTALVFDREVDGRVLTFRLVEGSGAQALLRDEETGSRWLVLTGTAIDGPLQGKTLRRSTSILSFWFAWNDWNPDTELFQG
jgi:hypothetical protein